MNFSTSFFAPDLAPADDSSHPEQDRQQQQQGPTKRAMDRASNDAHPIASDPVDHELTGDGSAVGKNRSSNSTDPAPKMPAPKKKKSTAAAAKGPAKRARPGAARVGGPKKARGGGAKKAKTGAPDASSNQPGAADADGDGGNSSESDNGPYCLCRGPDDHRFMIACDRCEDWFHGECIGMDKHTGENLVQKYICPNCTDGGRYTTRYKKMCSLAGCNNAARIYDSSRPSIFCSSEHCQAWWEQLIGTLPKSKSAEDFDRLTQEEFMGLLDAPSAPASSDDAENLPNAPWKLGKTPFEIPPDFWDQPASAAALTEEERTLLTTSAATRYQLGEEIVLCKKMLQLIDMALKQREAAIAAGKGTAKDLCGYDTRLDTVGATHQFALFLQSPQGETIFKTGRLDSLPDGTTISSDPANNNNNSNPNPNEPTTTDLDTTSSAPFQGMCLRRKCKPHNGWSSILAKGARHDIKELAAQAKELLDAEQRVRDGAAGRFRRRLKERNRVIVLDGSGGSSSSSSSSAADGSNE
ncbi:23429968-81d1-4dbf-810b-feb5cf56b736 [Thermothielavioides terrestris]|uniref:23429968-81d1-4dbf-810b-feb5cf56b736 n=1 Tax=Thermothielavioides terrestris TaxID=2587410 RepID=A0A446BAE2_9PEZI|nr:23429968-81d1-4dbf-810b-feb5cf56b736 [Thermothielavioides terrestris]